MFTTLKKLFTPQKETRLVVLAYHDGKIEIFTTPEEIARSAIYSYVDGDMKIVGLNKRQEVQSMEIDIYEDVAVHPKQMLYSIVYSNEKVPAGRQILPLTLYNTVWNFLEGAKGIAEKPATFHVN